VIKKIDALRTAHHLTVSVFLLVGLLRSFRNPEGQRKSQERTRPDSKKTCHEINGKKMQINLALKNFKKRKEGIYSM
jgi:hypothetical protein